MPSALRAHAASRTSRRCVSSSTPPARTRSVRDSRCSLLSVSSSYESSQLQQFIPFHPSIGVHVHVQLHTARTELRSYETRSTQVSDELIALRASSSEYEKVVARLRLELKEARERYEKASHEVCNCCGWTRSSHLTSATYVYSYIYL